MIVDSVLSRLKHDSGLSAEQSLKHDSGLSAEQT